MVQLFYKSILYVFVWCMYLQKCACMCSSIQYITEFFPAQKKGKQSHDRGILTKSAVTRSSLQWAQLPEQEHGRKGYSGCFKIIFYNTFSIKGPFYTY